MINEFLSDERGAATIDWVALSAGILLIGVTMVYSIFNNGVGDTVSSINSSLEAAGANVDTGGAPEPRRFGASDDGSTGASGSTAGSVTGLQTGGNN